jgi:hypothetical protein
MPEEMARYGSRLRSLCRAASFCSSVNASVSAGPFAVRSLT